MLLFNGFCCNFCCSVLLQCKWQQVAPGCEALDIAKTAGGSARTKDMAQHQARRPHVAILHAAESVQVVGLLKAAFQFPAGLRLHKLTLDRIEILFPETSPAQLLQDVHRCGKAPACLVGLRFQECLVGRLLSRIRYAALVLLRLDDACPPTREIQKVPSGPARLCQHAPEHMYVATDVEEVRLEARPAELARELSSGRRRRLLRELFSGRRRRLLHELSSGLRRRLLRELSSAGTGHHLPGHTAVAEVVEV
jgi:hypothetical protein